MSIQFTSHAIFYNMVFTNRAPLTFQMTGEHSILFISHVNFYNEFGSKDLGPCYISSECQWRW